MRARLFAPELKKWWTLAAVAVGLFMIMLDNTVVNVALPSIQRSLHMNIAQLEWIVTAYALTFAAFMLTGGKLADLIGRRRIFVIGLVIFTASSFVCGISPSSGWLIGARAVQGIGAAMMNPATLSIITATFPPRQRGLAIGIWAGVSAMALAIGPLVGGLLTEHVNWNWVFYINVPIGIVGIVVSYVFIQESRDTSHEQRLDLPGLLTSGAGLFAFTYALIESNAYGWTSPRILAAFVAAAVLLTAFVLLERHQRLPMLDLSLFRNGTFTGANTATLFVGLAMFGVFFYVSLFMQQVLLYSPVEAGATFLPMTVLVILVAPQAGRLSDKFGSRWLVGIGLTLVAGSLLVYSRLDASSGFWDILPGLILGGFGMAMTMTPTTAAAMGSVPVDKAGVGSAVLNSMRQVGGSLGIAIMGAVVAHVMSGQLVSGHSRPEAFTSGFHDALHLAAIFALIGAVVGATTLKNVRHGDAPARARLAENA
jgi:EmrB/QacA subfamily drug resistance transporter